MIPETWCIGWDVMKALVKTCYQKSPLFCADQEAIGMFHLILKLL